MVLSTDSTIPTLKCIHIFKKIFEFLQIVMFVNYLGSFHPFIGHEGPLESRGLALLYF